MVAQLHRASFLFFFFLRPRTDQREPERGVPAKRPTSSAIASLTPERGSLTSTGVPWFTEIGTNRELGMAIFARNPTVASMSDSDRPTRASERLTTK